MSKKEHFKLLAAIYLVLRRGDKVLLLRRANTGYQDGNYGLIAGHFNGNEVATQVAAREALEEAGIVVEPQHMRLVHTVHKLDTGISPERLELCFETSVWEGLVKNAEPEKCDDLSWHSISDLPQNTIPLVKDMLSKVVRRESYSEYKEEPV
jgi:8-oxo-dGTP diphosphatase